MDLQLTFWSLDGLYDFFSSLHQFFIEMAAVTFDTAK